MSNGHLQSAAAWLLALSKLTSHAGYTDTLEGLADELWPAGERDDRFAALSREASAEARWLFAAREEVAFEKSLSAATPRPHKAEPRRSRWRWLGK